MSLGEERRESLVKSSRLANIIYGGRQKVEKLARIWSLIESDVEFTKERRAFLNHSERYIDACRKVKRFQEIADERGFDNLDDIYDAYLAVDESLPLDVHFSMFIPIMSLHTSEGRLLIFALKVCVGPHELAQRWYFMNISICYRTATEVATACYDPPHNWRLRAN
jgi:hypothetical protein